jgi:hypothetical protein
VPLIEGISKPRRPPAKLVAASHSVDREFTAPAALPTKNHKHSETVANIANSLANAAATEPSSIHSSLSGCSVVSSLDVGKAVCPGDNNALVITNVDDIQGQILFADGLSNIDLFNSADLPPVDSDDEDDCDDPRPNNQETRSHSLSDIADSAIGPNGERLTSNDSVSSENGVKRVLSHRFAETGTNIPRSVSSVRPPRANKRPTVNRRVIKKKEKKKEKPPGPPPFAYLNADRYISSASKLVGYQFSLQLQNSCGFQDKIVVLVYTCSYVAAANNSSSMDFTLRAQTEVVHITERPDYGRTSLENVSVHFCLPQSPFNHNFDYVFVQVLKLDAGLLEETKVKEGNKLKPAEVGPNMNKISFCYIPRKAIEDKHIFRVSMKVATQTTVDLSNPIEVKISATLGVVRMSSSALFNQRKWFADVYGIQPYCEVPYSFATSSGQTLSLEQLYASRYTTLVADAMGQLLLSERKPIIVSLNSILEDEEAQLRDERTNLEAHERASDAENDAYASIVNKHEALLDDLDLLTEISNSILVPFEEATDFNSAVLAGAEIVPSKVIAAELGGCFLRRSIWKKDENWQYSTVNLNIHLMVSQHYSFSDLTNPKSKQRITCKDLHVIPTITLGCPAAHVLKYHDGGLRRMFSGLTSDLRKLMWMYVLQSQYFPEMLTNLFKTYPKDASTLFGQSISNLTSPVMRIPMTKKRFELANRLDMCSSQILGFAVTAVRTVCLLAANNGGRFMDVLARSLKIGFLLCLQSLLSTQGDELGMIEDMDMAALWLHLVTLRLVTYPERARGTAAVDEGVKDPNDGGQCDDRELKIRRDGVGSCDDILC